MNRHAFPFLVVLTALSLSLLNGCARRVLVRAPAFDAALLCNSSPEAMADCATIQTAVDAMNARFVDPTKERGLLVGRESAAGMCRVSTLPLDRDGTTSGMGIISAYAKHISAESSSKLNPIVAALSERAQAALLNGNGAKDPKVLAATITALTKVKPAVEDWVHPEYGITLTSDVITANLYDRFDEIVTLVVLGCKDAPQARIAGLATVADSEMKMNFGSIEREDTFTGSVNLKLYALKLGGGPGEAEAGGSATKTLREKLVRELSEKVLTTSVFPASGPLEGRGVWIVQRGNLDRKLRHSLSQSFTLDLNPKDETASLCDANKQTRTSPLRSWEIDGEGKLKQVREDAPPNQALRLHVMSVGLVRKIRKEKASWTMNEDHTPEEGDDYTDRYVVTDYQQVALPALRTEQYVVSIEGEDRAPTPLTIWANVASDSAAFNDRGDADKFIAELAKAKWQPGQPAACASDESDDASGKAVHASVMGAIVSIPGVCDTSTARQRLRSLHIEDDFVQLTR